ncbi:long-chain-fatty-acid--CoA ligase [Amycolatopsis sp. NBRC 101858]|uniref:AMP-binding protein n=1 Tax=Amycolatopsis sp. NBRC 101858 TaxID=3032200 RepID=UPI0024A24FDD|nr:AMP-binding protein [Amycolatopsis sp. NBRC 101858]GLY38916.1 long-chain-fatty-acid--CoA ligase [Amycolatopsis sp. NBRC 101858]
MNRPVADDVIRLRERWYVEGHYTSKTLAETLRDAGRRFPETRFVFASDAGQHTMSLTEVLGEARRVAAGLGRLGVRPGDVVAVQVPNRPELVASYFGVWLAGAVLVPITHIYGAAELGVILRDAGAKVLIVPDAWRSIDFLDRLKTLDAGPSLEHVVVIGERLPPGAVQWSELVTRDGPSAPAGEVSADDVCAVIYTSGTTGVPKGVQHTHNSLLCELRKGDRINEAAPGDCRLIPWPSGHIAGLLAVCGGITAGMDTVLMDRWDDVRAVELIEEFGCTITSGTPLHVDAILRAAATTGRNISTLRFVQVGGTNVPPALVARADAAGVVVARAYGSTEHPRVATAPLHAPARRRSLTDGMVRFGDEVRIVDEQLRPVPAGEAGEILTRGPSRFAGYRDPVHDRSAFVRGGWFRTGDVGLVDDEGYLVVTDRIKDIIIRGGENIASKEVEDILATHPRVRHAAVVAEPDPKYGERVAAFVVLADDGTLDVEEVRELFAGHRVAPQKAPERIEVVADLPRAPSGKVRKYELRDRLRAEHAESTRATG